MSSWTIIGNSVAGVSHVSRGRGCEDSHGWSQRSGVVCLVVADGAGSQENSAIGSEAAVRASLEWANMLGADSALPLDMRQCFESALESVVKHAEDEDVDTSTLATTLGVVVIRGGRLHVGQVGDTIVIVRQDDGTLETVSPAEKFEYVNETVFITSETAFDHLRLAEMDAERVTGVALSTDGLRFKILSDLEAYVPYEPFFEDVFTYAAGGRASNTAVAKFLDGLDDQSGDDKTLVVATLRAGVDVATDTEVVGPAVRIVEPNEPAPSSASVSSPAEDPSGEVTNDPLPSEDTQNADDPAIEVPDRDGTDAG